jgi:hypothetical protein
MAWRRARGDSRVEVARYRVDRLTQEIDGTPSGVGPGVRPDDETDAGQASMDARAQFVELAVQQAIRRGDFDGLPGAGRPLEGLDGVHDPDWWIRRKIEREKLTGLGPPALTLRTEDAGLDSRLDRSSSEQWVRETLDDFNARVVEARRQLQGGPPVVTRVRDVESEIARWRERREGRWRAEAAAQEARRAEAATMSRRDRRRARRAGPPSGAA